jgi:hypothetical protein
MSTNADAHDPDGAQDANHTADQTPRALDTVHVDGLTGLFHATPGAAGDHATAYSRRQATLAGYQPCPTCFSGAGGDDA